MSLSLYICVYTYMQVHKAHTKAEEANGRRELAKTEVAAKAAADAEKLVQVYIYTYVHMHMHMHIHAHIHTCAYAHAYSGGR